MGLDLEALFEPGVARRENMNIKTNTTPFQFSRPHTQSLSLTHSTPFNHSTPPPLSISYPSPLQSLIPSLNHSPSLRASCGAGGKGRGGGGQGAACVNRSELGMPCGRTRCLSVGRASTPGGGEGEQGQGNRENAAIIWEIWEKGREGVRTRVPRPWPRGPPCALPPPDAEALTGTARH